MITGYQIIWKQWKKLNPQNIFNFWKTWTRPKGIFYVISRGDTLMHIQGLHENKYTGQQNDFPGTLFPLVFYKSIIVVIIIFQITCSFYVLNHKCWNSTRANVTGPLKKSSCLQVFCTKCFKEFHKFKEMHRSIFDKVCNVQFYLRRNSWHRCFPVNFVKVFKTSFLQNTFRWLFLCLKQIRNQVHVFP